MDKNLSFQSIVETHDDPFLIVDSQFRVVAANRAFQQGYRVSLGKVLGRPCYEVIHAASSPCHQAGEECPLRRVLETGHSHSCLHVHVPDPGDGSVHYVRVRGFPLYLGDGTRYLGESVEDISVPGLPGIDGDLGGERAVRPRTGRICGQRG